MDFHEVGFGATLNGENGQLCWFQLSDTQRQQVGDPWGPQNPQALNRYSYVQNNAVKYIDPSGHSARCKRLFGYDICLAAVNVVNNSDYPIEVTGDSWDEDCQCYQTKTVVVGPGESSRDHGIADADQVRTIRAEHPIDGHGTSEYYDPSGTGTIYVENDTRPDHVGDLHIVEPWIGISSTWKPVKKGPKGDKE
ncbi:MAG TPA: hypothetical protein PKK78_22760 [Kouleothrix sp.]|nr:hypothetical protein [Kouleothrix sp.]